MRIFSVQSVEEWPFLTMSPLSFSVLPLIPPQDSREPVCTWEMQHATQDEGCNVLLTPLLFLSVMWTSSGLSLI